MADVVYFIQDMLFTSKVREVAKQTGLSVQGVRDPAALAAAATGARLVIVDLRLPTAGDALARLAADPATSGIPSIGFVDHEKTEVMDDARPRLRPGDGQGSVRERAAQAAGGARQLTPQPARGVRPATGAAARAACR